MPAAIRLPKALAICEAEKNMVIRTPSSLCVYHFCVGQRQARSFLRIFTHREIEHDTRKQGRLYRMYGISPGPHRPEEKA